MQDCFRGGHTAYAACHAKGYVDHRRNLPDPTEIDCTTLGTGGNVIENQFVRSFVTVAARKLNDFTNDPMISELNAFDDCAIAHVEAGNYALRKNGFSSCSLIRPSNSARPLIAALTPVSASATRSVTLRMPPEAWIRSPGNCRERVR